MKHFFFTFLSLICLAGCSLSNQDPTITFDPKVQQYIAKQNTYIRLTDKQKAMTILEDEYEKVLSFMEENDLNKDNYFLVDGEFSTSTDFKYITIPIRHYNSLKMEMERGIQVKRIPGQRSIPKIGNLSGRDGYLLLNLATNEIDGFQLW